MRGRVSLCAAGLLLVTLPLAAQEAPRRELPGWAPRWKVGTWWVVTTWQRDTRARLRSPGPAEGAEPVTPELEGSEPLPGYPPLRDGIPVGYKPGNQFRFEVARREKVRYPDDAPGTPPEEFWVVRVATEEGEPKRTAELWYTAADLSLAKVVIDPAGQAREHALHGTALLAVPASQELGFPLDWPDLPATVAERAVIPVEGRPAVEQKARKVGAGKEETWQLRLAPEGGDPAVKPVSLEWKKGEPFWSRFASGEFVGRLDAAGTK